MPMYWFLESEMNKFSKTYSIEQLKHWKALNTENHWYWQLEKCIFEQMKQEFYSLSEKEKNLLFEDFMIDVWSVKMNAYTLWMHQFLPLYEEKINIARHVFGKYRIPYHTSKKISPYATQYSHNYIAGLRMQSISPNPESKDISIIQYRSLVGGVLLESESARLKFALEHTFLSAMDQQILYALLEIQELFEKELRGSNIHVYSITD